MENAAAVPPVKNMSTVTLPPAEAPARLENVISKAVVDVDPKF
jgi:hypothetical protein